MKESIQEKKELKESIQEEEEESKESIKRFKEYNKKITKDISNYLINISGFSYFSSLKSIYSYLSEIFGKDNYKIKFKNNIFKNKEKMKEDTIRFYLKEKEISFTKTEATQEEIDFLFLSTSYYFLRFSTFFNEKKEKQNKKEEEEGGEGEEEEGKQQQEEGEQQEEEGEKERGVEIKEKEKEQKPLLNPNNLYSGVFVSTGASLKIPIINSDKFRIFRQQGIFKIMINNEMIENTIKDIYLSNYYSMQYSFAKIDKKIIEKKITFTSSKNNRKEQINKEIEEINNKDIEERIKLVFSNKQLYKMITDIIIIDLINKTTEMAQVSAITRCMSFFCPSVLKLYNN